MKPEELRQQAVQRHPKIVKYLRSLTREDREDHLRRLAICLYLGLKDELTDVSDLEDLSLIATGFRAGFLH
jgi:hypothetical protein